MIVVRVFGLNKNVRAEGCLSKLLMLRLVLLVFKDALDLRIAVRLAAAVKIFVINQELVAHHSVVPTFVLLIFLGLILFINFLLVADLYTTDSRASINCLTMVVPLKHGTAVAVVF